MFREIDYFLSVLFWCCRELCNKMEADFVIELCEYLHKVPPRNIGIITPYKKQKEIIRTRLRQREDTRETSTSHNRRVLPGE